MKIYDIGDDPFFGKPKCALVEGELCLSACEFGIAGPCLREAGTNPGTSATVRPDTESAK